MSDSEFNFLKHEVGEFFDVNGDGTVVKEVLVAGEGEENPTDGCEVTVSYVGRLHDDKTQFDANETFQFTAGSGVIQGWSDVIKTMVVGEKSRVVIQASKGYGEQGAGAAIPPNATLEFDITLKHFTSEKDLFSDGSVTYKTLKANPSNWQRPDDLSKVTLAFSIKVEGSDEAVIRYNNETPLEMVIDGDSEVNKSLPSAFESLVKEMTTDSVLSAKVAASRGFTSGEHAGKNLKIDIKLVSMESPKGFWELSMEEKLAEGERLKNLGNDCFKTGDYHRAVRRYQSVVTNLEYIASDSQNSVADKKKASEIVKSALLNMAQVKIKEHDYSEAVNLCRKVLVIEPHNVKGLYRLAVALQPSKDYDQAERALIKAQHVAPEDQAIVAELKKVKALIKKQNESEKKKYKGIFSKLQGFASDDRPVTEKPNDGMAFGDEDFNDDLPDLVDDEEGQEHHHEHSHSHEHSHEGGCCGGH